MRGGCAFGAKFFVGAAVAVLLSGCIASTRTPDRLYPVAFEMEDIRAGQAGLFQRHRALILSNDLAAAKAVRNEIIGQRMYAIDVQYTQYENALTRESQEVGFGALTTAGVLGTASTLFTPVVTKSILSGLSTAVLATKGHYDSEILLAQTIKTIQKQMRASRNLIAAAIIARMTQSVIDYPLPIAMSDVEDYYNAGTLTTGLIDTSTTVGIREDRSKDIKEDVTQAPAANRPAVLKGAMKQ
jgi:hypothetical protein